jgi:NarL family two-component system response regulator LiaR
MGSSIDVFTAAGDAGAGYEEAARNEAAMTDQGPKIRVLICDDHQVVRQGLRTFLQLHPDVEVVGECCDGLEAVHLVQRLEPDIVLMDLVMPDLDGVEATRRIKALGVRTQVIALTSFTEDDKVFPAIQAGAASYLLKDVSPDDLVEAIRAAHRGEPRLHPDVARKLMAQVARASRASLAPGASDLTPRELDVLRLVAQGLTNQEIAHRLVISDKTVKTHVSALLGKLDLADRTQLAIHAIRSGLVDGE